MRSFLLLLVASLAFSAAASATTLLPGFHSPSGNIRCYVGPGTTLRCSIAQASYAQELQERCLHPNGSGVDWHGFELRPRGKGAVTCSGGILYNPSTQRPSYSLLPYGTSWRRAGFTCTSQTTGVTCRNAGGHGLFVSRGSWRAW
jgi:hypothetical protein